MAPTSRPAVDFSDPASVVQAMFDAAAARQFELQAGLCDPQGQANGDVQAICAMATDLKDRDEFVADFATARIAGGAEISADGSQAQVRFVYGADGSKRDTITLVRRDGRWYLSDF